MEERTDGKPSGAEEEEEEGQAEGAVDWAQVMLGELREALPGWDHSVGFHGGDRYGCPAYVVYSTIFHLAAGANFFTRHIIDVNDIGKAGLRASVIRVMGRQSDHAMLNPENPVDPPPTAA